MTALSKLAAVAALITLAVQASMPAGASAPAVPDADGSIVVGGLRRTYVLHVPASLPANPPLVLAFHGHGGTGRSQERLTGMNALADRRGFIVVYPDGVHRSWNDGRPQNAGTDDLAFVRALVGNLSQRFHVDSRRVYATGFSNGAAFSEYLGCKLSDEIAAIAPVSGSLPAADRASCRPGRPLPVLEIAGTTDPIMPYDGGEVRILGIDRGTVISAGDTAAFWAQNASCDKAPHERTLPASAPSDGTSVRVAAYSGCANGAAVELYTIVGGGHAWPGGLQYLPRAIVGVASNQLQASETIVTFLLAHPMR